MESITNTENSAGIKLVNTVILADDYDKLVLWYKKTLALDVTIVVSEGYHYTGLGLNGKEVIGIADAKEMDCKPSKPRNNNVFLQLYVKDIKSIFEKAKNNGGEALGPYFDEKDKFYFGTIKDVEGNAIWVVESKK